MLSMRIEAAGPGEASAASRIVETRGKPLHASPIVSIEQLGELPDSWRRPWDELAGEASEANVFSERWFVEAGARHLAPAGETWLIGVWESGDRLIGLMPVRIERLYGRVRLRHVENWRHHHSFLGTPLVRAGREIAFWTAMFGALDSAPWSRGFFHINGLVEDGPIHRGLIEAAARLGRPCEIVHRRQRALLASKLSSQAYYEQAIRKKKRKEIGRLTSRLNELGKVSFTIAAGAEETERSCEEFLALEAAGWKGKAGSAMACSAAGKAFFREVMREAQAAGRLQILRMEMDGRAIAMLVNLIIPPGAFSFKIAFDESYARFSPGVLLQIENLRVLDRCDVDWMDSCAMDNHPMIDSLWTERRSVVRVTIPLAGKRRRAIFAAARTLEKISALLRRLITPNGART